MSRMETWCRYCVTAIFCMFAAGCSSSNQTESPRGSQPPAPRGAATAAPDRIPQITPQEAKRRLDGDEVYVYLDVRTVTEFEAGHVPGALNIPVVQRNSTTGEMRANAVFLSVVRANFAKDAQVIVGCKSGGRSARAVALMLDCGYRNVFNLAGGFSGKGDESGEIIHPGWSTLNFPVEHGDAHSYQSLRHKAAP